MRLVTLLIDGAPRAGVVLANGNVLDLAEAAREAPGAAGEAVRTASLQSIIEAGPKALDLVRTLADRSDRSAQRRPEDHVTMAPLPSPAKNVFCVGRNYAEHIAEGDRAQNQKVGVTEHPVFFTKPRTAVIGPGAAIPSSRTSRRRSTTRSSSPW